jgi:hypothetical protein
MTGGPSLRDPIKTLGSLLWAIEKVGKGFPKKTDVLAATPTSNRDMRRPRASCSAKMPGAVRNVFFNVEMETDPLQVVESWRIREKNDRKRSAATWAITRHPLHLSSRRLTHRNRHGMGDDGTGTFRTPTQVDRMHMGLVPWGQVRESKAARGCTKLPGPAVRAVPLHVRDQ